MSACWGAPGPWTPVWFLGSSRFHLEGNVAPKYFRTRTVSFVPETSASCVCGGGEAVLPTMHPQPDRRADRPAGPQGFLPLLVTLHFIQGAHYLIPARGVGTRSHQCPGSGSGPHAHYSLDSPERRERRPQPSLPPGDRSSPLPYPLGSSPWSFFWAV